MHSLFTRAVRCGSSDSRKMVSSNVEFYLHRQFVNTDLLTLIEG